MPAAGLGEAPPQHLVVAFEEQQAGRGTPAARPRRSTPQQPLRGEAAGAAVDPDRQPVRRRRRAPRRIAPEQVDRQVVDGLVAEVLEDLQAGGAAGARHARHDDDLAHATLSAPGAPASASRICATAAGVSPAEAQQRQLDARAASSRRSRAAARSPSAAASSTQRLTGTPTAVAMRKMPLPRSSIKPVAARRRRVKHRAAALSCDQVVGDEIGAGREQAQPASADLPAPGVARAAGRRARTSAAAEPCRRAGVVGMAGAGSGSSRGCPAPAPAAAS